MVRYKRIEIARMRSKGPWYSARGRVLSQLGRRQAKAERYSLREIEGMLYSDLKEEGQPSTRTARDWEARDPDFPEKAIDAGVVKKEEIPRRLRTFLKR